MNNRHKLFCDEYLSNGLNGTQAYKKVYKVNDKVAEASASRLLLNVKVKQYIEEQQKITEQRLQITKEELIRDLIDIKNINKEDAPPFAIKAIEVINKMLGYNATEKSEVTIHQEPPLFSDDDLDNI
jgi:phage terminase small subunit